MNDLNLLIQQSVIYAQVAIQRELQPYEALMYQQLCRTLQTYYSFIDASYQRAKEQLNESPDTS